MFKEIKVMKSKFGKQLKTVPWKFYNRINIIIDIRKSINEITLMLDTAVAQNEISKLKFRQKMENEKI